MMGNVPMDMVFMAIDDKKDCQAFVQGYTHDSATVPQMKKYADCIDILHPQTLSENQYLLLSAFGLLVIVTIFFIVHLVKREK